MRNLILTAVFALAACGSPHPDAVTQANGHEVALYVTPGVSGEKNDMRVEVRGPRIPDISEIAMSMPDMKMPAQRVGLTEDGSGSYSARNVRFSMAGTWHVSVRERDTNGTHEFAALDVIVR